MRAAFTDQRERLRRIVENALAGSVYSASREVEGRMLLLEARRLDGRQVSLRFRGVKESEASAVPAVGDSMRLEGVGSARGFSLLRLFVPFLPSPYDAYSRVRIEVGAARLDIVCQDAEWWEDERAPGAPASP